WRVIGTKAGAGGERVERTARTSRRAAASAAARASRRASALVAALVLLSLPAAAWAAGSGEVTARSANLRAGCSLDAAVLGSLARGAEVEILGTLGDWHRVRLEDGREGCMHESVLAVAEESVPRVSAAERLGVDLADPDSAEL